MKKLIVILSILIPGLCYSQTFNWNEKENQVYHLNDSIPGEFENIKVKKLCTQEEATSFLIWVKDTVPAHYHIEHNETLYFMEGKGEFKVGGKKHVVKAGDFITVPKNVVHAFQTTSKTPVKAISIQAPEFLGKDRIWIKEP